MKQTSKGFTLIELLVVIAITGILASIVLASLNTARKKGRDARRVADMKQVQLALELYYDANSSSYVAGGASTDALWGSTLGVSTALVPNYMSSLPHDPNGATAPQIYTYQALDGTGAACASGTCAGYIMRAQTEATSYQSGALTAVGAVTPCAYPDATAPYDYCVKP